MKFQIPNAPKLRTKILTNLLGVDFTSIMPAHNRASNMINLVNNNGYLESRPGYDIIGHDFSIKLPFLLQIYLLQQNLVGVKVII